MSLLTLPLDLLQGLGEAVRGFTDLPLALAVTNKSLEQIVRLAEPLDRMGKRVMDSLARVTGRGSGQLPGE